MADEELEIQKLEEQFPFASGAAFAEARRQVLASGESVLESHNGALYWVRPDGQKQFIKFIEPPTRVTPGSPMQIR